MQYSENPNFSRPIIVVSRCLGFANCRYDGKIIPSPFIEHMKPFVEFIDVCPECDIGLGVPREPIFIIDNGDRKLIQQATDLNITENMQKFSRSYLDKLEDFDAFILKSKSPSCGLGTTKVFKNPDDDKPLHNKGNGLFAEAVLSNYSDIPVIDEKDILDPLLRDHFLIRTFSLASFREVSLSGKIHSLIEYHTKNKLLFMAYNKQIMAAMGDIIANRDILPVEDVYENYLSLLLHILSSPAGTGSTVNALMHAFGYFSRHLTAAEKFSFIRKLQQYREDSSFIFELRKWFLSCAHKFNVQYLSEQTFFYPYPEELSGSFQIV